MKIKPAQATLNALRDGQIMNELAQAFYDASQAVRHKGKPAVVRLEITFEPLKHISRMLEDQPQNVTARVITKLPQQELEGTILFATDEGPSRETAPSRQTSLPGVSLVNTETGEIKNG